MKVVLEPEELRESPAEHCAFCDRPTRYWHEPTNNPVCQVCAKTHKVSELTNWRKSSAALKAREEE